MANQVDAVWIDYAILAVLSIAMFIYAYLRRPGNSGSSDGDDDGGVPAGGGDSSPTEDPPMIGTTPDPQREREPTEV